MQLGFYFNQLKCLGCYSCVAACRNHHYLSPDMPDIITLDSVEEGEFPKVELHEIFLSCFHCKDPACITVCPSELLVKRTEDGVVVIKDSEECSGCKLCLEACPYSAIKFSAGKEQTKIYKCDLCSGREKAACVTACPVDALAAGPMEDLIAKHGDCLDAEGYPDRDQTRPSIIFAKG